MHLAGARKTVQLARQRLYRLLCAPNAPQPSALAQDIATGQIKDIIVGVVAVLLNQYRTAVAVGLPVAVLLLRNGLQNFYATLSIP